MPYIIETTTPDPANVRDYGRVGDATPGAPSLMGAVRGNWPPKVTRTAVATLGEARAKALNLTSAHDTGDKPPNHDALALPESGGTVGPLPDGTVIEVRRVKWRDITNAVDLRDVLPTRENMIAAFNAA
jgi:hypothetical protein